MSEYIVTCDEEVASWIGNDVDSMKPLVHCRDCKWRAGQNRHAIHPNRCLFFSFDIEPDGYCKWGERDG